jgi:hypothetical protein
MKSAFSYIAALLFVLTLAQVSAYAQDGPDNEHPVYEEKEEKIEHEVPVADMDNESDPKVLTPATKSGARDSSSVRTLPPRPAAKSNHEASKENKQQPQQAQSGDDSILSFNFIYYIIQRFKLQDIIE